MTQEHIVSELTKYIYETNPVAQERRPIPLDESLLELGIMDSFGIVELVAHIEQRWEIQIHDSELTREKFGSVNKMANLIVEKQQRS